MIPRGEPRAAGFRGALASKHLDPAAIPFVFIDDAWWGLRVSNLLLLALSFVTGHAWGRHAVARPWLAGLVFLLGGTVLVAATIALRG